MQADDFTAKSPALSAFNNKGGASAEIARKYCICMNGEETQSITQWEKSHRGERVAHDKRQVGNSKQLCGDAKRTFPFVFADRH